MYISDYCIIKLKIIAEGYDTIFSLFWKKGEGYPAPDYLWSVSVIRLINVRSVAEQLWIFFLGYLFPFWCNFMFMVHIHVHVLVVVWLYTCNTYKKSPSVIQRHLHDNTTWTNFKKKNYIHLELDQNLNETVQSTLLVCNVKMYHCINLYSQKLLLNKIFVIPNLL